jgi:hypothetical protein
MAETNTVVNQKKIHLCSMPQVHSNDSFGSSINADEYVNTNIIRLFQYPIETKLDALNYIYADEYVNTSINEESNPYVVGITNLIRK